ncbi:MAG TPA: acyltransferase family protein [Ktedonobacterales bacterium]
MTTSLLPTQADTSAPAGAAALARRYELDWLRAFVVLGLIPIHAAVFFSSAADLFIKNSDTNEIMALLGVFAGSWGMPLLFLVAGASAYFALSHRTPRHYLGERSKRLLIPFAFATLTIIPLQVYAIVAGAPGIISNFHLPIHDPNFTSSYLAFYVEYLRGYLYFLGHFSTTLAIIFWGHLWFIPRLFAYALCALPLCFFLRSPRGIRLLAALDRLVRYPGGIFVFVVPLAITEMFLRAVRINDLTSHWPLNDDWVQFTFFLLFFVYGYLIFASSTMQAAIIRHGWIALALGIAGFGLALTQSDTLATNALNYSLGYAIGVPIRSLVSWFWVVAILSFAMRRLAFTNGLLSFLNEAAFPVYVLHMPIVTIVGRYVVQLDMPWLLKFLVIIAVALALTLIVFQLIVRRFKVTRFLLGLKPRLQQPPATATAHAHTIITLT